MRVIVTGSRTWEDVPAVWHALDECYDSSPFETLTVVHGACIRGADRHAKEWCEFWKTTRPDVVEEPHPARWELYGRAAGFIRNTHMAQLGAQLCLAFIRDGSRGASHCARACESGGIVTRRFLDRGGTPGGAYGLAGYTNQTGGSGYVAL